jgi:hypothetical protein
MTKYYDRAATPKEVRDLDDDAKAELIERLKTAPRWLDSETFLPYAIVDMVRYDLEP